jgi:hypothetical protein
VVVPGLDEIHVRWDVAPDHRQMTVIVHDVEIACVDENRACDPPGDVRTVEGEENAEHVLLPANSPEMKSPDKPPIEPDFSRAFRIINVRSSHDGDGVPSLQERVAETDGMLAQATQLGPGYVFADDQYLH